MGFPKHWTLKSLESKCARCRLNKAKSNNTTTNIHINSSGRSYNLGMLAEDPDGHTMSVDQMGPVYGENGKSFGHIFFFLTQLINGLYNAHG